MDASEVNERVNNMADWAAKVDKRLDAVGALVRGILASDESEFTGLIEQLAQLEGRLTAAPDQKHTAQIKLAEIHDQANRLEARLELIESNLLLDVYAAINGDGKPKYTNEKQRQAALATLAADDAECVEIRAKLADLDADKVRAQAELAHVDDAFKTDRIVYHGCVARLENLTARLRKENGK